MTGIQRRAVVPGVSTQKEQKGGPEGTGCGLFWVFLFNPIRARVNADCASTTQVMRPL